MKKVNILLLISLFCSASQITPAHIAFPDRYSGIGGLFMFSPQTTKPLMELAEILLRGESPLSAGERELIAAYVSLLNQCTFCYNAHSATARHLLKCDQKTVEAILRDIFTAPVSNKLRSLLTIAGTVQISGSLVTPEQIAKAKVEGATDKEIHDTVLIASFFCMFNRYIDGLGIETPNDPQIYDAIGQETARLGYDRRNK